MGDIKFEMMQTLEVNEDMVDYILEADNECYKAFTAGKSAAVMFEFDDCFIITSAYAGEGKPREPQTFIVAGKPIRINRKMLEKPKGE